MRNLDKDLKKWSSMMALNELDFSEQKIKSWGRMCETRECTDEITVYYEIYMSV